MIKPYCRVGAFPYLETFDGYEKIFKKQKLKTLKAQDITDETRRSINDCYERLFDILKANNSAPLRQPTLLSDLLKRPEVRYHMISAFDGHLKDFPPEVIDQVEYEIKYEGFIKRQLKSVERFKHIEYIRIPKDINYELIGGLSKEIRQKLKQFTPLALGQAHRISGVTPAAVTILMVYLRKLSLERAGN